MEILKKIIKQAAVALIIFICLFAASCTENGGGDKMSDYKLEIVEFLPGSETESEYIYENSAPLMWHGGWFRVADATLSVEYVFKGVPGQKSYLSVNCGHELYFEVSSDRKAYETAVHLDTHGRSRGERVIDLTPYMRETGTAYVRVRDAVPTDGWGTLIYNMRYATLKGAEEEDGSLSIKINDGWTAASGGKKIKNISAGTGFPAAAGSITKYERTIEVPAWWGGNEISLVIPWVESDGLPKAYINGAETAPSVIWGNRLVLPLPAESAGKKIKIEIEAVTPSDTGGLWGDIYLGLTELVAPPEPRWELDGSVMKLQKNYAPYDTVKLNALAGNFLSVLFDTRYGLFNFDTDIKNKPLYYPHDGSRALLALADEERWSPVVRLELITELYEGVKSAMVPGSDYEIFLKRDTRPKYLRPSAQDGYKLEAAGEQDAVEPFADIWAEFNGEKAQSYTDETARDSITRRYIKDGGSLTVSAQWHDGTQDTPTMCRFKADGLESYEIIIGDLDMKLYNRRYMEVRTPDGVLAKNPRNNETIEIEVPGCGFLLLRTDPNWLANSIMVIWDVKPEKITLAGKNGGFDSVILSYPGAAGPSLCVIGVYEHDNGCGWPFRLAKNILGTGKYGSNGFDPSYICGVEGLGTAALAAGAYIKQKYGLAGAGQAAQLAKTAMDASVEAYKRRNSIPSIYYDRVAACDYLIKSGFGEYLDTAEWWADICLGSQTADGNFYWHDYRQVMTLLRGFEATGGQKYMDAALKFRNTVGYSEDLFTYKHGGEIIQGATHAMMFGGAGDMGYLGYLGDNDTLDTVMSHFKNNIDDTGVFDCSDLNPYFLGMSLRGTMKKQYSETEPKHIIKAGEYCLYAADGSYEVLKYPTAYIDNPYMLR